MQRFFTTCWYKQYLRGWISVPLSLNGSLVLCPRALLLRKSLPSLNLMLLELVGEVKLKPAPPYF